LSGASGSILQRLICAPHWGQVILGIERLVMRCCTLSVMTHPRVVVAGPAAAVWLSGRGLMPKGAWLSLSLDATHYRPYRRRSPSQTTRSAKSASRRPRQTSTDLAAKLVCARRQGRGPDPIYFSAPTPARRRHACLGSKADMDQRAIDVRQVLLPVPPPGATTGTWPVIRSPRRRARARSAAR
jgi:hypothetical protein